MQSFTPSRLPSRTRQAVLPVRNSQLSLPDICPAVSSFVRFQPSTHCHSRQLLAVRKAVTPSHLPICLLFVHSRLSTPSRPLWTIYLAARPLPVVHIKPSAHSFTSCSHPGNIHSQASRPFTQLSAHSLTLDRPTSHQLLTLQPVVSPRHPHTTSQ